MDRKSFLRNVFVGAVGVSASTPTFANELEQKKSTYDTLMDRVGFNHIPNNEEKTMKTVLHRAHTRGNANHGWLNSYHSFSFANYHNPERMNFGVLRVLNDDAVAAGKGFGKHPHDNMEIISIPLSGDLEHQDNMGNETVIRQGDIQVMSAGTGLFHSEYNKNTDRDVQFLQIWLFPNARDVKPRYDQQKLDVSAMKDKFAQILSPNADDAGVWIHQNAYFHMGNLSKGTMIQYNVKSPGNGVYAFILEGDVTIDDQSLSKRDGFGLWDTSSIEVVADSDSTVLLMEVPMTL